MKTFSMTDIGKSREMNQDCVFCSDVPVGPLPNLFMVADGMGGHNAGDFASDFTIRRMVELVKESEETDPEEIIRTCLARTNYELFVKAETEIALRGMGTTMVAATVTDRQLCVANVGDSRLYIINRKLRQVTNDHSYVQEMVLKGQLKASEARLHPQKNIITRAIGALAGVEIDCFHETLKDGDEILMCTDGLTNMVDDGEIANIIRMQRDIVEKVERLVQAANDRGGRDNISVIMIDPFA